MFFEYPELLWLLVIPALMVLHYIWLEIAERHPHLRVSASVPWLAGGRSVMSVLRHLPFLRFLQVRLKPKTKAPGTWFRGLILCDFTYLSPAASRSGRRWQPRLCAPDHHSTRGSGPGRRSDPPGRGPPIPDPGRRCPGEWDNPGPRNR